MVNENADHHGGGDLVAEDHISRPRATYLDDFTVIDWCMLEPGRA